MLEWIEIQTTTQRQFLLQLHNINVWKQEQIEKIDRNIWKKKVKNKKYKINKIMKRNIAKLVEQADYSIII